MRSTRAAHLLFGADVVEGSDVNLFGTTPLTDKKTK